MDITIVNMIVICNEYNNKAEPPGFPRSGRSYTVLCYAVLYYTVLYYAILYYTILHYNVI